MMLMDLSIEHLKNLKNRIEKESQYIYDLIYENINLEDRDYLFAECGTLRGYDDIIHWKNFYLNHGRMADLGDYDFHFRLEKHFLDHLERYQERRRLLEPLKELIAAKETQTNQLFENHNIEIDHNKIIKQLEKKVEKCTCGILPIKNKNGTLIILEEE